AKWPEMLTDLQASIRDGYHLEEHMERLATVPLLVLDDLGAERAREDRDRDWGNVKLYEVLEARVNAQRATLWTSNLDGPAIRSRYGDRLLSRLIGLGPVVSAPPGLPDRRIASTMEKQRLGKDKDLIPWRPTTGA
ncbi:MAG TPA: hypothetical protein VN436_16295, partial [Holophaga sp.]|nr:hypothetical protein [Holophaga sp.]